MLKENYYDNISHFSRDTLLNIYYSTFYVCTQNVHILHSRVYTRVPARSFADSFCKLQTIQQSRIENIN